VPTCRGRVTCYADVVGWCDHCDSDDAYIVLDLPESVPDRDGDLTHEVYLCHGCWEELQERFRGKGIQVQALFGVAPQGGVVS
jgi:hypothetical protein